MNEVEERAIVRAVAPHKVLSKEAELFARMLRTERANGNVTPVNPIKGKEIARRFNRKFGTDCTDEYVREWTNEVRAARCPIASSSAGYFWALTPGELAHTIAHLRSRVKKINAAAAGLELCFRKEVPLFENPEVESSVVSLPVRSAQLRKPHGLCSDV